MIQPEESDWTFSVWDLAGQKRFRDVTWISFSKDASGVVYVVDSAAPERLQESGAELKKYVLENPMLNKVPLLVKGNKCDLEQSVDDTILLEKLGLTDPTLVSGSFYASKCSVKTKENIEESFEWLVREIIAFNERN